MIKSIKKIFGGNIDKNGNYEAIIIEGLNKYQLEYLSKLNGSKEEEYLSEKWDKVLGNRVELKKDFIKNEYLQVSTLFEKLSSCTADELKKFLKENNLKVSGKKSELIERIIENVEESTINLFFNFNIYKLSEKGKAVVAEYKDITANYKEAYMAQMKKFIEKEKYEKAIEESCKYSNMISVDINTLDEEYITLTKSDIKLLIGKISKINKVKVNDLEKSKEFRNIFKESLIYGCISTKNTASVSKNITEYFTKYIDEQFKDFKIEEVLKQDKYKGLL